MDIKMIKLCKYHHYIVVMFCLAIVMSNEKLLFAAQGDDPSAAMTNQMGTETETGSPKSKAALVIDAAKTLFSLPSRWPFMLKDAYQYGRNYFSPPNLDFRSGSNNGNAEEGTGEKVKEAVVKTMDESKATVEGSAKTAAKLTENAMDKTVNKLKKSLSTKHEGEHEPEL